MYGTVGVLVMILKSGIEELWGSVLDELEIVGCQRNGSYKFYV